MMMNHRRLNVTRRKSKENPFKGVPLLFLLIVTIILSYAECFAFQMNRPLQSSFTRHDNSQITTLNIRRLSGPQTRQSRLYTSNDDEDARVEEEVRIRVLGDRRNQIRSALKSAEKLRNFRLSNGYIPELDEDGKPVKSDGKTAVGFTAFVVAGGAVALRVGGRAALISGLGLDFVTDNPELKNNLDQILMYTDNMDPIAKAGAFIAAWTGKKTGYSLINATLATRVVSTSVLFFSQPSIASPAPSSPTAVKVLCLDFLGVALAISSGILFGGVFQGAVASAGAATIGSCVAFTLAKLDTPVRKKALELLEEYPSLRGIDKVVSRDGLKAILTLRLAPVLPIPIGLYNYIYAVTNVPVFDFAGGIFLGSLKPYLLDSYLGYFGKSVVDGSLAEGTSWQDIILLVALGVSVLIGVFASQLAAETWDSVLEQVEEEKKMKEGVEPDEEKEGGIVRQVFGVELPQWVVGFQLSLQQADLRMTEMILDEYEAKVWNYTKEEPPPANIDPAKSSNSPEVVGANLGIDYVAGLCDGLVMSPKLFSALLKYSDPLYDESEDDQIKERARADPSIWLPQTVAPSFSTSNGITSTTMSDSAALSPASASFEEKRKEPLTEQAVLQRLDGLEKRTKRRLELIEERLLEE